MGIVIGGGEYCYGDSTVIEAQANDGYHFVSWSDGNKAMVRMLVVTEDVEYEAIFEKDKDTFTIDSLIVYPNPTRDFITINTDKVERVEIMSYSGSLLEVHEYKNKIDLSELSSAAYILRITTPYGVAIRRVVVVK